MGGAAGGEGLGGAFAGGGGGSWWGDSGWRGEGGTCPQGQALVNHRLPLPPLTLPLTIPGLNIGTELVGKGTSPSRHFVTLDGPKSLTMGSKWAHFTCLCTPNGLVIILEKCVFDPFLTLFVPQKTHFQGFLELWSVITGHHGLKTGQKHLFEHPKWSRNKFGKNDFRPFLDPQMTHVTLP